MESLSKKRIHANMRRMADQGVDWRNPAHVSAYLLARQQSDRPKPEQILAIAQQSQIKMEDGTRLSSEFYLVPRTNFSDKCPAWLQDFLVTEDDLRERHKVPEQTDLSTVLIVDGSCELKRLGKRVRKLSFEQRFSHRFAAPLEGDGAVAPESPGGPEVDSSGKTSSALMPLPENSARVPGGSTSAGRPGVAIAAEEPEVPTEKPGGAPLKIEPPQGGPPTKKTAGLKAVTVRGKGTRRRARGRPPRRIDEPDQESGEGQVVVLRGCDELGDSALLVSASHLGVEGRHFG